jgi:hypothetical protein
MKVSDIKLYENTSRLNRADEPWQMDGHAEVNRHILRLCEPA